MAQYALMVATVLGFLLTAALTNLLSPLLRLLGVYKRTKQPLLRDKRLIPAPMGGLALTLGVGGALAAAGYGLTRMEPVLLNESQQQVLLLAVQLCAACAAVGAVDDLLTLVGNWHLHWVLRLAAAACLSGLYLREMAAAGALRTVTVLPIAGRTDLGGAFLPAAWVLGTLLIHACGTTGSSEGGSTLAGLMGMLLYAPLAAFTNAMPMALLACSFGGALLALLWWAFPPARITAGRTGGMVVGAGLWAVGCASGWGGLLLLLGAVPLLNAAAVPVQWVWYTVRKEWGAKALPVHGILAARGWGAISIGWLFGFLSAVFAGLCLLQLVLVGMTPAYPV